jgi:hypothetical protein
VTPDNTIQVDINAMAKVIQTYRSMGYEVRIGNPDCLPTCLYQDGRLVHASFAISLSDYLVFQWIAGMAAWRHALVIGNSFGFSTFLIAALCSDCQVDAIDAEVEGSQNRLGSELTRRIADSLFPGVRLTVGFSPVDLPKACRFDRYELIFIDGHHTNDQLIADFKGIMERRAKECVVVLHDVGMARMGKGWDYLKVNLLKPEDRAFELHFTSFGSTMVVRGCNELASFMEDVCLPLSECLYYFGARHTGLRSVLKMLNRSIGHNSFYRRLKAQFKLDSRQEKVCPILEK